ncbi:hypothetical protein [Acutalibacter sp. 1XD8-36]|uniref:hypothetical protein n=1 Tax=Acutalibacter sp. 1XD8-36 TaxID=2320852 RepID=UPI0026133414|nr:hypothetical protein [Acutalibacter sp. 1XD8-36]
MKVNILGAEYTVEVKDYEAEEAFSRRSIAGFCDGYTRKIVVCNMDTYPGWQHEYRETIEQAQKETLRHEIVHAFLDESGLADSGNIPDCSWAKNEEMIDWFARQGAKVYRAWQEVGAL